MTESKAFETLVIVSVIIGLIILIPFVLGYFHEEPESIGEIIKSCSNKEIVESSTCVLDLTKTFYKYNIENLGKDLTFEELKESGGVCTSWSDYYNEIGQGLGFNTENVVIKLNSNISHEFNVWSNEKKYCILDQNNVSCFDLNLSSSLDLIESR